jgi:hypothetical protein
MMWPMNRKIRLLLVSSVALFSAALLTSFWWPADETLSRTLPVTPSEHLTRSWQNEHCPPESRMNLDEIALPEGKVADVEILDLPSGRIYLPRLLDHDDRLFSGTVT